MALLSESAGVPPTPFGVLVQRPCNIWGEDDLAFAKSPSPAYVGLWRKKGCEFSGACKTLARQTCPPLMERIAMAFGMRNLQDLLVNDAKSSRISDFRGIQGHSSLRLTFEGDLLGWNCVILAHVNGKSRGEARISFREFATERSGFDNFGVSLKFQTKAKKQGIQGHSSLPSGLPIDHKAARQERPRMRSENFSPSSLRVSSFSSVFRFKPSPPFSTPWWLGVEPILIEPGSRSGRPDLTLRRQLPTSDVQPPRHVLFLPNMLRQFRRAHSHTNRARGGDGMVCRERLRCRTCFFGGEDG